MNSITKLAAFSLSIVLFSAAFKSRFELDDTLVYFLPFGIFLFSLIILHTLSNTYLLDDIASCMVYSLLFLPALIAFLMGDAQQASLFIRIVANISLAILVVIFPWSQRSLHLFFTFCAVIGTILSVHTIFFLGSDIAIEFATSEQKKGYLTIGVAISFSCLAALYLVFYKQNPVTVSLLVVNWLGLALSRGRGPFFFCAFFSLLYIVYMLCSKRVSIGAGKKFLVGATVIAFIPIVAMQLLSLGVNRGRWGRLIEDPLDDGRLPLMMEAIHSIENAPLLGNGLGAYLGDYGHPHNILLQFGVDSGAVGIIFVVMFIAAICYFGLSSMSKYSGQMLNLSCICFLFFIFMIGNMMKSGDAYLAREYLIVSAFPLIMYQQLKRSGTRRMKRYGTRRKKRSGTRQMKRYGARKSV